MQRDQILIAEMIEAIDKLVEILGERDVTSLLQDEIRRDALLWNFAVLGEAANQLSDDLRTQNPRVPWRRPIDLRNRIVHGYWEVDLNIIVNTIRIDLPSFRYDLADISRNELDS